MLSCAARGNVRTILTGIHYYAEALVKYYHHSTKNKYKAVMVAQVVEQVATTPQVMGSNLIGSLAHAFFFTQNINLFVRHSGRPIDSSSKGSEFKCH